MRFFFFFVLTLTVCEAVTTRTTLNDSNCTVQEHSLQKVLSRQKRWFVFPKDCSIGITLSILKAILEDRPPGMRLILELTIAYAIPPLVEGFRLDKFFLGKTYTAPPPSTTMPTLKNQFANSSWSYRPAYVKPPPIEGFSKSRRRYFSSQSLREYRERRQIFKKFEELGKHLEINSKACIMRSICEVKSGLLPEGQSFIQDVARIIFTFPDEYDDEYTKGIGDNKSSCARRFSVSCPFSPLAFFMINSRLALKDWKKGH